MSYNQEIARAIILDHYENPENFVQNVRDDDFKDHIKNNAATPSCIDNITIYLLVKNNTIEDIKFSGVACAISTSSTDIMSIMLKKKTLEVAREIILNYLNMIDNKPYKEELLEELIVYVNVNKQVNRINCAKVGIKGILNAIEKYERTK